MPREATGGLRLTTSSKKTKNILSDDHEIPTGQNLNDQNC